MANSTQTREAAPHKDYLLECLREWPLSHALLRAIECRKIRKYPLEPPILEIGCGDGFLSALLFQVPPKAGVDIRPSALARVHARGQYRRVLAADAAALPFPGASFSGVFSNCVLEHVDRLPEALAEIARVLRMGGALLATIPTPRWESEGPFPSWRRAGFHGASRALNGLLRRAWHHVTLDEREGWQDRLERASFRLQVWEPYRGRLAYAHYARCLPGSSVSLLAEKIPGLGAAVRSARRRRAPARAGELQGAYLAEEETGACALLLAIRS
jgi:SAM-dependent methyltransferase